MENTQGGLSGKTCRARCPLTMGRISGKSLKALSASKTPGQMFLCLRQGAGCPPARSWATVILSPGASSTPRRVGASHKDGNVYLLSSILMEDVPDRYSLSPKACQGILRRAAKRGKELPEVLKAALEQQARDAPEGSAQGRATGAGATDMERKARRRSAARNRPASS